MKGFNAAAASKPLLVLVGIFCQLQRARKRKGLASICVLVNLPLVLKVESVSVEYNNEMNAQNTHDVLDEKDLGLRYSFRC